MLCMPAPLEPLSWPRLVAPKPLELPLLLLLLLLKKLAGAPLELLDAERDGVLRLDLLVSEDLSPGCSRFTRTAISIIPGIASTATMSWRQCQSALPNPLTSPSVTPG
jgi:hypothetical protein